MLRKITLASVSVGLLALAATATGPASAATPVAIHDTAAPASTSTAGTVTMCAQPFFMQCAEVSEADLTLTCGPVSPSMFPEGVRSAINNSDSTIVEFYRDPSCTDLEARLAPRGDIDPYMTDAFYVRALPETG